MAPATPNARPSFATSATEPSDTPPVVPGRNHARIVAEIAQEFRPRLDTEGFSAVRNLGAQLRTGAVPCDEPAHTHKRCKMCGNVCHARMTSCSSCCLPFVDRGSWEPATMPRPGGDAYSETDSDTNSDDVDSEEEVNEEVTDSAAPAVDAASVMERRRRERRAGAADKSRQTTTPPTTPRHNLGGATGSATTASHRPRTLSARTPSSNARTKPWASLRAPAKSRSGSPIANAFAAFTQTPGDRRRNSRACTTRSRRSMPTRGPTARVPPRCASRCCIHVASTWHQRRRSR